MNPVYQEWFDKLGKVSPSFCLAKWKQVTLHLQFGHKHSCHHPGTHKIDPEAVKDNPSALHNTTFSKETRQQMLDGIKPPECGYCWKAEAAGSFSDRIVKSSSYYGKPYFEEVLDKGANQDIFPSYLEVSFSNVCNFKCVYCKPHISSKWMEEVKQHGGYQLKYKDRISSMNTIEGMEAEGKVPITNSEENPYVDAFWKWWPELYRNLTTFRITGGEPLLCKDTFKVLDFILEEENPNKNLRLEMNTNMCVPDKNFNSFTEKINKIIEQRLTAPITIFTSCEAKGKKAEYIRTGLEYDKHMDSVKKTIDLFVSHKNKPSHYKDPARYNHLTYMCTFNMLSVTSFIDFCKDIAKIRESVQWAPHMLEHAEQAIDRATTGDKLGNTWRKHSDMKLDYLMSTESPEHYLGTQIIRLDIPFLNAPTQLAIETLTDDFGQYFEECYQYLNDSPWFPQYEVERFERVWNVYKGNKWDNETRRKNRSWFVQYVDQLDTRRNTNFIDTFPEFEEFYNYAKSIT
jgi:sulfatase maturation enzyme AslB (radical SAM superfamily)